MKDSKKNKTKSSDQERVLLDTLLGSDDELAFDDCSEEFLKALDIDPSSLTAEFISRLEKESSHLPSESIEQTRVQAALRSLREQVEPTRHLDATRVSAQQTPVSAKSGYWTNRSVFTLSGGAPPVERITQEARKAIFDFTEAGNVVPPLDPFALAEFRKIKVVPREDIRDARTRFIDGGFVIEFNPNRPRGRVRYSICHEITHTFFPDCREAIRNRSTHEEMASDEWQLEMLCNIGAGELLMPFGTLPNFDEATLSIHKLMEVRKEYDVSTEALLLRIARITSTQCCLFSASRKDDNEVFQIDYVRPSNSWKGVTIASGFKIPKTSVIRHCTAIGYSDNRIEQWIPSLGDIKVECVGVPPYPEQIHPRVMGFIAPAQASVEQGNRIQYKGGDATDPRETDGYRIITHLVNDKTPNWGGAFARAVKKKWQSAQIDFEQWARSDKCNLSLGKLRVFEAIDDLAVATIVAQHGYGESIKPRIRYGALKKALDELAEIAANRNATVHMPKIGSGQAGGNWDIISELIEEALCDRGIEVFVYVPSYGSTPREPQGRLTF